MQTPGSTPIKAYSAILMNCSNIGLDYRDFFFAIIFAEIFFSCVLQILLTKQKHVIRCCIHFLMH